MYCLSLAPAPATATKIEKDETLFSRLQTVIVLPTVEVEAGTI